MEEQAPEPTIVFVTLAKGKTFTTPFGLKLRSGVPIRVPSTSPHLEYFKSSSRFSLAESVSTPRTKAARLPAGRRRPAGKKQPVAKKSDAPPPLSSLTRKELVNAARELGITVRSSDSQADIVKLIDGHNSALLPKAQKNAAAAAASTKATPPPSSDDDAPPPKE